jgi:hypothetical protein
MKRAKPGLKKQVAHKVEAGRKGTIFNLGDTLVLSEERWAHLRRLQEGPGIEPPPLPAGLRLPRQRKRNKKAV